MNKATKFPISILGYEIEGLDGSDAPRLAPLYRACSDYFVLERGEPSDDASVREEFENFPLNRTEADKFVFGLKDTDGEFVGLLACDRDYPQAGCWWIVLLMINGGLRGKGLGRALCDDFFNWLKLRNAERVELGVLKENERALRFWQELAFKPVRMAGPVSIGAKQHMIQVLGRPL